LSGLFGFSAKKHKQNNALQKQPSKDGYFFGFRGCIAGSGPFSHALERMKRALFNATDAALALLVTVFLVVYVNIGRTRFSGIRVQPHFSCFTRHKSPFQTRPTSRANYSSCSWPPLDLS
jgi:hypothetical protein